MGWTFFTAYGNPFSHLTPSSLISQPIDVLYIIIEKFLKSVNGREKISCIVRVYVSIYTFVYLGTGRPGVFEIKNPQNRGFQRGKFQYLFFETLKK